MPGAAGMEIMYGTEFGSRLGFDGGGCCLDAVLVHVRACVCCEEKSYDVENT